MLGGNSPSLTHTLNIGYSNYYNMLPCKLDSLSGGCRMSKIRLSTEKPCQEDIKKAAVKAAYNNHALMSLTKHRFDRSPGLLNPGKCQRDVPNFRIGYCPAGIYHLQPVIIGLDQLFQ